MLRTRTLHLLMPAVAVACATLASCDRTEPVPAPDIGVLATVNGMPITETDLLYESSSARQHKEEEAPADRDKILQTIIMRELAYQTAVDLGIDKDPEYQEELRRMNAQVTAFKRKKLADVFFAREIARRATVSDEEAREYFEKNAEAIRSEIHIWQILRRDESLIEQDLENLQQGEAFADVASKRFLDLPQTDRMPWDLGYLRWEQVPELWWSGIRELKAGETSGIIRGQNERYWIIHLVDRRRNQDISYEDVEHKVKDVMKNEKIQQFREDVNRDLLQEARILYSNAPKAVPGHEVE